MSNFKKLSVYADVPCEWVSATCPSDGEVERLQAENAKLRKELNHWRVEQTHAYSNWQDAYERAKKCEDENAKLRAERDEWHRVAESKQDIIDHMRDANAENRKLRELASILCFCMQIHKQCDDCKLNGAKGEIAHDPLLACDGLHEMLRELGIEVPE